MLSRLLLLLLLHCCYAKKPNIVIMYMDDMGWGDIGVHGKLTQSGILSAVQESLYIC